MSRSERYAERHARMGRGGALLRGSAFLRLRSRRRVTASKTQGLSNMARVTLIDLPIVFRRWWHATEHEPVSEALHRTVRDVRMWADGADHVACAVDTPPYLRTELYPEYKAHREKAPEQ